MTYNKKNMTDAIKQENENWARADNEFDKLCDEELKWASKPEVRKITMEMYERNLYVFHNAKSIFEENDLIRKEIERQKNFLKQFRKITDYFKPSLKKIK